MTMTILTLVAVAAALATGRLRFVAPDVHVVDGDTIKVAGRKWRIAGYDSPEWNQPGGNQASRALRAVLAEGCSLALLGRVDAYGRPVATIFTTRGPLAWRMASAGHGHGEGTIGTLLTGIARMRRRGLWAADGIIVRPSSWRKGIRP